jgi:hypothetical protein
MKVVKYRFSTLWRTIITIVHEDNISTILNLYLFNNIEKETSMTIPRTAKG